MNFHLNQPYFGKLWDEVSGVIQAKTAWLVYLLDLFEVEEVNGISPFAVNINTPGDLFLFSEQLLRPPRIYPRGPNKRVSKSNLGDNEVYDVDMKAPDGALVSEDKWDSPLLVLINYAELSPDVIVSHIQDIELEYKDSGGDIDISKDNDDDYIAGKENSDSVGTADNNSSVDNEFVFDGDNSSKAYTELKSLLS